MVALKLTAFAGEMPRIDPRLLPNTAAQSAVNSRLDDGTLTPIRAAAKADDSPTPDPITIYWHLGAWLAWDAEVNAAPGPVDDTRLYYTGDGAPKMLADGNVWPLALDGPTGALTATLGGSGSGDAVTRLYVYTWVTDFGEESEPSPASTPITWKPGNTVMLSGFAATPAGRNITKQRIYRTQTGSAGTFLYFIAERAADTADFNDTVAVDAFVEPLATADWNPPPDTLQGLVSLPNGMMAGFSGRDICFCEPFRPHAWPEKYRQTASADIVALAAVGGALIVLTDAQPEIGVGSTPGTFQFTRIENNWPCINARGVVNLGFAACYPTHEGLVAIDGGGGSRLVSAQLFSREDWKALNPDTMVAGQLSGRYVAFYETATAIGSGSFSIAVGDNPFLTRTDTRARATYFDVGDSALYFVPHDRDQIWQFDAPGAALETQYWRSKEFVLNAPHNFGAILVDAEMNISAADQAAAVARRDAVIAANELLLADPLMGELGGAPINAMAVNGDVLTPLPPLAGQVVVGVIADGVRVAEVRTLNRAARLPAGFKARIWEIDVAGDVGITSVVMGTTMADVAATP